MDTDLIFGPGLSLFGHQHIRGCLHQFWCFINASYLLTYSQNQQAAIYCHAVSPHAFSNGIFKDT